eukprot:contig_3455_g736
MSACHTTCGRPRGRLPTIRRRVTSCVTCLMRVSTLRPVALCCFQCSLLMGLVSFYSLCCFFWSPLLSLLWVLSRSGLSSRALWRRWGVWLGRRRWQRCVLGAHKRALFSESRFDTYCRIR